MGALISFIASVVGSWLTRDALKYIAYKTILTTLIMTILPIILINVFSHIIDGMMSLINHYASTPGSSIVVNLTGLAGYIANLFRLPEAFAIIVSAVAVRLTFRLIPFVRL